MNNKVVAVVVVVVVVLGGFFLFKDRGIAPTELEVNNVMPIPGSDTEEMIAEIAAVREFNVTGLPFSFTPNTMVVDKGDTVKITFKNNGGTHDFRIDEFSGAATRIINSGEEETITFVVDKTGVFEYYCSVGNHRAMGMIGTLTVR